MDTENIGPAAGSYRWIHLTQTIQNWVNGNATNYGFLLKASNEGAAGLLKFDNQAFDLGNPTDPNLPHLRIQWNNWNGLEPWYKFESHKLSDRMSLAVNVANGNLVIHATDLAIKGTGLDLHVDRYHNSLADNVNGGWHLGNGWNPSVGCDLRLDIDDFDGLTLHMPDGYAMLFSQQRQRRLDDAARNRCRFGEERGQHVHDHVPQEWGEVQLPERRLPSEHEGPERQHDHDELQRQPGLDHRHAEPGDELHLRQPQLLRLHHPDHRSRRPDLQVRLQPKRRPDEVVLQ